MRLAVAGLVALVWSVAPAAQDTDAPVRAGTPGVSHPRLVTSVSPLYPSIAQNARISGLVVIEAIIDEAGRVASTTISRSVSLLDAAAIDALRQWRFEPPRVNGRPVRFATTVKVTFRIYDALAPLPAPSARAYDSGMPADFAVSYGYGCPSGTKTGDAFLVSPARMAIFTPTTHDLEPVYRAVAESGLLSRVERLRVWEEPGVDATTVSNDGVSLSVTHEMGYWCSDQEGAAVYDIAVRAAGTWQRLWPPSTLKPYSGEDEPKVAPIRALLQQLVDKK